MGNVKITWAIIAICGSCLVTLNALFSVFIISCEAEKEIKTVKTSILCGKQWCVNVSYLIAEDTRFVCREVFTTFYN